MISEGSATRKTAIISGAGRGIGKAIALKFCEQGYNLGLIARTKSDLEAIKKDYENDLSVIEFFVGDMSSDPVANSCANHFRQKFTSIDVVVANIGDGRSVNVPLAGAEQFQSVWNINFRTAELVTRAFLDELIQSNGNMMFISSIAGLESIGAPTDYSVAKSAIIALSKNLARKLAPQVRVNCVAPGNIIFEGSSWEKKMKSSPDAVKALLDNNVPMKRFGTPGEVAEAVYFLCSEKASFITGACLTIDGGQTVGFH